MIYIKELVDQSDSVTIRVDGILNRQSIPILKNVCQDHLNTGKEVILQLDGLMHISREGRDFLQDIKNKVIMLELPEFLRLETQKPTE